MAGDVTIGFLKRISQTPEGDNGCLIGGQNYWDVLFTGGSISNATLSNVTLVDVTVHGLSTLISVRVVQAAGMVALSNSDSVVVINKTVGAATPVLLPATPSQSSVFIIKDGKGDAALNPITLTPASGTIDGQSDFVMASNYQAVTLVYNGTEWNIL